MSKPLSLATLRNSSEAASSCDSPALRPSSTPSGCLELDEAFGLDELASINCTSSHLRARKSSSLAAAAELGNLPSKEPELNTWTRPQIMWSKCGGCNLEVHGSAERTDSALAFEEGVPTPWLDDLAPEEENDISMPPQITWQAWSSALGRHAADAMASI